MGATSGVLRSCLPFWSSPANSLLAGFVLLNPLFLCSFSSRLIKPPPNFHMIFLVFSNCSYLYRPMANIKCLQFLSFFSFVQCRYIICPLYCIYNLKHNYMIIILVFYNFSERKFIQQNWCYVGVREIVRFVLFWLTYWLSLFNLYFDISSCNDTYFQWYMI